MKKDYNHILGFSKEQVIKELGDEFNIPYSKIWRYRLQSGIFFERNLYLFFDDNHYVTKYKISKINFLSKIFKTNAISN